MSVSTPSEPELDASIVIPAYKRPELLRKAVVSALTQDMESHRYEVIVVDSSPDDQNARVVEALKPPSGGVSLSLFRKAAEGPGPSRALGARHARGRIVAFLDSDCQATPGWLEAGLAAFRDRIGIVQGRTLPEVGQPLSIFCRYVRIEEENPRYECANIFYRRECMADAGEPSRDMTPNALRPSGGEDSLMAWRVKRSGWQSTFARDALVYHEVLRISVWFWLCDKSTFMLPWLTREVPEMRSVFYLGYFLDRTHACLALLLVGVALSPLSPLWLACGIPYVALRSSEPTRSLTGVKRIARAVIYLPRDLICFGQLLLASIRYRTLLL